MGATRRCPECKSKGLVPKQEKYGFFPMAKDKDEQLNSIGRAIEERKLFFSTSYPPVPQVLATQTGATGAPVSGVVASPFPTPSPFPAMFTKEDFRSDAIRKTKKIKSLTTDVKRRIIL